MYAVKLTSRQMRILVEAVAAKVAGACDPDVEALVRAGCLASTRPGGTVLEVTKLGLD